MANNRQTKRQLILLIILAVALYAIVPQLTGFDDSLKAVKSANIAYLGLSLVAITGSYMFAGLTYYVLANKLRFIRTVILEVAATFINRLLPAGIGGMGVNYVYLRHNKHSQGAAASVVAINNLLGVIGHILLFTAIYFVFEPKLPPNVRVQGVQVAIAVLALLVIVTWVLLNTSLGKRFQKQIVQVRTQLAVYWRRPSTLLIALLSSMALTTCVSLAFFACLAAFDVHISYAVAFLVFSAGFAIGNATPTPGGLGGVEAGLVVGLIAYDVPRTDAIAVVLVFRLISFWIPTAVGALAFLYAQRKKIL